MAIRFWLGGAPAVAQVSTGSIDSVDATPSNNVFTVTIGTVAISVTGDTDVATTATALRAALNASTHPYFSTITWSGTAGTITGTADTAGVPFVAALTKTGAGTGTVTDFSDTTANSGPAVFTTAANWTPAASPVNSDVLHFSDTAIPCVYDINTSLTGLTIYVDQSFTGTIGLPRDSFALDALGSTFSTSAAEYREDMLNVSASLVEIGRNRGPTRPAGSSRIKIYNSLATAECVIHDTGPPPATAVPAVYYSSGGASHTVEIVSAPGGVGLSTNDPSVASQFSTVSISGPNGGTVSIGDGTTLNTLNVRSGSVLVMSAGTIATINQYGGIVYLDGDGYTVTAYKAYGGICYYRGDVDITTLTLEGGTVDCTQSNRTRTIGSAALDRGVLSLDDEITLSGFSLPSKRRKFTITDTLARS